MINQFLAEVERFEERYSEEELFELSIKAEKLIEALCSKRLILHDPGTYALTFILGSSPIYFQTFFQMKSALKMLLSFIETDNNYLDLTESELPGSVNYMGGINHEIHSSYELFCYFFKETTEEQERIQCSIKNLRWLYSREGILKQIEGYCDSIDEALSYLSCLLQDLKSDRELNLLFGQERNTFEAKVNQLMAEKSAEKAILNIHGQIKEDYVEINAYLDVFKPNGFRLFDYLMKNHLSSGTGWQSDVAFFYRIMEERDKLIHAKQKKFREFLENEYPKLQPMGKFKVWNDINTDKRNQIYFAAKKAIGLK